MDDQSIITPYANKQILTRGLPKTGQTIIYTPKDDGKYEAGWWQGRLNSNNLTRFIAKSIAGDDIVFDRSTGLMWAADGNAAGCANGTNRDFASAISWADLLVFAGYTDWRLPNIRELQSIVDYGRFSPAIDQTFFPNTGGDIYWSSTTHHGSTTVAWFIYFADGIIMWDPKTVQYYLRCVRDGV